MSYSVDLSIEGRQKGADNSPEVVTLNTNTRAEAFYRSGAYYFLYEESMEGFEERCKVKLKLTPKLLEITRTGVIDSKLVLESDREHTVDYRTPYGIFYIGTTVKEFELIQEPGRLTLRIEYTLAESGKFMSDNTVTVLVDGLENAIK